ncbi:hypothetical protein GCM10010394_41170 [Streptomyces crystallinus]|uniref:D-inositol 3-phosphate glycosyltransferase n=1 Tax=Streptomyces crystallinus TaxID=68191 RepID=A0ABN1GA28_9ACTN
MRTLRIGLLTDGGYPYTTGESRLWCDRLVRGLARHEFDIYALSRSAAQEERGWVALPPQVRRVRTAPLWAAQDGGRFRTRSQPPRRLGRRERDRFATCLRELAGAICMAGPGGADGDGGQPGAPTTPAREGLPAGVPGQRPGGSGPDKGAEAPGPAGRAGDPDALTVAFDAAAAGGSVAGGPDGAPAGGPSRFADALYGLADLARECGGLSGALRSETAVRVLEAACRTPGASRAVQAARVPDYLAFADLLERALRPLSLDWYDAAGLGDVDLCHAAGGGCAALPGLLAKRFFGVPLLVTEYGVQLRAHYLAAGDARVPVRALTAAFHRRLAAEVYERAALITPGNTHTRRWQEKCGADRAKLRTVYPGMAADRFQTVGEDTGGGDPATLVWVGRVDPTKDLIALLHAFAEIRRAEPDARLRIFYAAQAPGTAPGTHAYGPVSMPYGDAPGAGRGAPGPGGRAGGASARGQVFGTADFDGPGAGRSGGGRSGGGRSGGAGSVYAGGPGHGPGAPGAGRAGGTGYGVGGAESASGSGYRYRSGFGSGSGCAGADHGVGGSGSRGDAYAFGGSGYPGGAYGTGGSGYAGGAYGFGGAGYAGGAYAFGAGYQGGADGLGAPGSSFSSLAPESAAYLSHCRALAAQLFPDEAVDAHAVGDNPVSFEEIGGPGAPELADAYASGSVVVLSSVVEGFPVSLVEAMFCGRATVSTDAGAVVEVIGGTGLVVPPRNPRALADACVALLRDPERRERLGAAARARALELFTVEQNLAAFRGIYLELMSHSPVHRETLDENGAPVPFAHPAEAHVRGSWAALAAPSTAAGYAPSWADAGARGEARTTGPVAGPDVADTRAYGGGAPGADADRTTAGAADPALTEPGVRGGGVRSEGAARATGRLADLADTAVADRTTGRAADLADTAVAARATGHAADLADTAVMGPGGFAGPGRRPTGHSSPFRTAPGHSAPAASDPPGLGRSGSAHAEEATR